MLINTTKTMELNIGPWDQQNSGIISTQAGTIEHILISWVFTSIQHFPGKSTLIISCYSEAGKQLYLIKVLNVQGFLLTTCYTTIQL